MNRKARRQQTQQGRAQNAAQAQQHARGHALLGRQARGRQQLGSPAHHEIEAEHHREEGQPDQHRGAQQLGRQQLQRPHALAFTAACHHGLRQGAQCGQAHLADQCIETLQRIGGPLDQQKVHGLRQGKPGQNQHRQRGAAAEHEDGTPAMVGQQPDRDTAANGRAQRVAGRLQRDRQTAPAQRGIFAGNHVAARQNAAHAQARDHAQHRKLRRRLAPGRSQHAQPGHGQAQQNQGTAPQLVGHGRQQQRTCGHAEEAGTEQKTQLRAAELPVPGHRRSREGHHQHVKTIDHVQGHAYRDDRPLEGRHGPLVQMRAQILFHRCLLVFYHSFSILNHIQFTE